MLQESLARITVGTEQLGRARPCLPEEGWSPSHTDIPSLGRREMQCTLPFPTFPSPSAGYYMFIEASRPRVTGDKARLISPLYNITAKYYCVSFYYHMYGKHIGEYPLGKGKPSLMWAPGEYLQPLAPAAVSVTTNSRGQESYSSIPSSRVGCCTPILFP